MTVTHAFVSTKDDGGDDTLVRPSDWNAEHVVEGLESGGGGTSFIGVRASASVQAISATTWTPVAMASEALDTDAFHSTVTNNSRFTIPAGLAGKYFVAFDVLFDANNATGSLYATIYKNGVQDSYNFRVPADNAAGYDVGTSRSMVIDLAAGDYIELYVYVDIARNVDGALFSMFKIDSGSLGTPPGARATRTTDQTGVVTVTDTAVIFNDADIYDTDGFHDPATNPSRMTIPAGLGGRYLLTGSTNFQTTGGGYRSGRFRKNGTGADVGGFWRSAGAGSGFTGPNMVSVVDLVAGDYVEIVVQHDIGSNATLGGATVPMFFEITRLGGMASADGVSYDNGDSGLAATDVQDALDEIVDGGHALGFVGTQVSRAATQSIGNAAATDLSFDTEVFDTDGFWSSGTDLTVPAGLGGKYLAVGYVAWASNSAGTRFAYLTTTGTGSLSDSRVPLTGDVTRHVVTAVLTLAPGNTLKMAGYQSSGGALNVTGTLSLYKIETPALGGPPGAKAYNSTTQTMNGSGTNGGNTLLTFNSEAYDTDGFHDTGSNTSRLTIPAGLGGKYLVGYSAWGTAGPPGAAQAIIDLWINGASSTRATGVRQVPQVASVQAAWANTTVIDLVAGDYVEAVMNNSNASTFTIGHASAATVQTTFWIMRLGGSPGETQSQGTAFPAGPATYDRYFRTDRGLEYYYDGTRWLTVNEYVVSWLTRTLVNGIATSPSTIGHALVDTGSIYVTTYEMATFVSTGNDGSNYWSITLQKNTVANASTVIGTLSTQSNTTANWVTETTTINAVVDGTTHPVFYLNVTSTGSPGGFFGGCTVRYRRVG